METIGALVGRFQIHQLHDAHHHVIKQVVDKHKKVIIFLGVTKVLGSKKNPLDFDTRKKMIQESYPDVVILAIPDCSNNLDWSRELDKRIREVYSIGDVLLYGGRDSFIPYYRGIFKTKELEQHTFVSGTEVRKKISDEIKNSVDFRAGIIYNSYNQHERVFPTVDISIINSDKSKVLLCQKPQEDGLRFVGGFVKNSDGSLEISARRICYDKIKCPVDGFRYISSSTIKDWRYRGEEDSIMTILFVGTFMYGKIEPSQNLLSLRWIDIEDINESWISKNMFDEHKQLMKVFIDYNNKNKKNEVII